MNSLWRARKGTTLVEILVVMVVLLVGIMSVVIMFPTGFRVVRAAENQTIATKLAQAEVERWKNMADNLPDGILPLAFSASGISNTIINDQDPGPQFVGMTDTGTPDRYYPGNAGNFRMVINETTSVPIGSYFQTGGGAIWGSRYNLAFSPIELDTINSAGQYPGITVKSGDLTRRVGDSQDTIYLRQGQYGIDYTIDNAAAPAFHVSFSYDHNSTHEYHISYSYTVTQTNGTVETRRYLSQVDQTVNPDANGGWVEVPIPVPTGFAIDEIDEGTDSCARGFVQVNGWSPDPYEFTVADPILGIIAFNPQAHNTLERTVRGIRPVTARICYRIYDPRIIREERVVPTLNEDVDGDGTNDSTAIKLALKFVLNCRNSTNIRDGDATDNPDEPTFEGLVYSHLGMRITAAGNILVSQPMLVIDLATGLRVELLPGSIDFKGGIVHLPERANLIDWTSNVPQDDTGHPYPEFENVLLKGRHLRFFYRADGDWSVQCQKAYTYYLREYDNDLDYQRFKLVMDPRDGSWKLLFVRCMAGQSVAVDFVKSGRKISGKVFRISDDTMPGPGGMPCSYVSLGAYGTGIKPNDRIIVVGTSFRARVIWRDGKAWRYVDIDTNLTRNSTP